MLPTVHPTDRVDCSGRTGARWYDTPHRLAWRAGRGRRFRPVRGFTLGLLSVVIGLCAITLGGAFVQPTVSLAQGCPVKKILFVGSTVPLEARDEPLYIYLSVLDNIMTVRSAAAVQAADANGKDLIIISESAESFQVQTKLRDVAVPIITWEGWLQDDLQMTGPSEGVDYGENLRQQAIQIVNPAHPLAAGLKGVVKTVTNNRNKFHWGRPNGNATIVAVDVDNAQHAMIYAYKAGDLMVGQVAPARRVFIHNATGPDLSIDGWWLFDAAVTWAVGCADTEPTATPTLLTTAIPTATPTATATATATATTAPNATATSTASVTPTGTLPTPTRTPTVTQTPLPTSTPRPVRLTIQKQDYLFIDANEDGFASAGDTLLYRITLHNGDNQKLTSATVEDTPDSQTTLLAGTVRTDSGQVITGNQPDDRTVSVAIGEFTAKQTVNILFQVQVNAGGNGGQISNQAQVRYAQDQPGAQGQIASDDPDTPLANDVTITPLGNPAAQLPLRLYLPSIVK